MVGHQIPKQTLEAAWKADNVLWIVGFQFIPGQNRPVLDNLKVLLGRFPGMTRRHGLFGDMVNDANYQSELAIALWCHTVRSLIGDMTVVQVWYLLKRINVKDKAR
jgi:hypothetical protein